MAEAKICDRCGNYYVPPVRSAIDVLSENIVRNLGGTVARDKYEPINEVFDLCPGCFKSFVRWFDTEEGDTDD